MEEQATEPEPSLDDGSVSELPPSPVREASVRVTRYQRARKQRRSAADRLRSAREWADVCVRQPICGLTGHYERHCGEQLSTADLLDFTSDTAARIAGENELVAKRLTWLLSLNGFLFAAYGVALSGSAASYTPSFFSFQRLVAATGIASAVVVVAGVLAAHASINDLKGRWLAQTAYFDHGVPPFSGPFASLFGRVTSFGFCFLMAVIWGRLLSHIWSDPPADVYLRYRIPAF